jgi:hypothetical protein
MEPLKLYAKIYNKIRAGQPARRKGQIIMAGVIVKVMNDSFDAGFNEMHEQILNGGQLMDFDGACTTIQKRVEKGIYPFAYGAGMLAAIKDHIEKQGR